MKKFFVITLICALLLALFGCSFKVYKCFDDNGEKGIVLDVDSDVAEYLLNTVEEVALPG